MSAATHTLRLDVVTAPRRQHEVTPSCSCGWVGGTHMSAELVVARRTATVEHTQHVQAIARPRVPVRKLDDGTLRADCRHCPWTYDAPLRVIADEQARYHRVQHQRGDLAVTR
ncbi:hypothetical protein [Cellulomonas sp.]|uniref:hypothetical protein n=1 Tax=Cellulomonas sp. TaxID=40001 RepID=UPI001B228CD5|nr:hypothetical protein [Cellulomonas sp.]MBO9556735.1 hypothetical protein [Cellulomonas sp.]